MALFDFIRRLLRPRQAETAWARDSVAPVTRRDKNAATEVPSRPPSPLNDSDIRGLFEDAIGTGEVITVRYYGGNQPSAIRDLVPRQMLGERHVECVCLDSSAYKTFRFDRMIVLPDGAPEDHPERWQGDNERSTAHLVVELVSRHRLECQALGWAVLERYEYGDPSFGLHRRSKDGSPYSIPTVSLEHVARTDTGRPSAKPWVVKGSFPKGARTARFVERDQAVAEFMRRARARRTEEGR